jgi:hypothetical protein
MNPPQRGPHQSATLPCRARRLRGSPKGSRRSANAAQDRARPKPEARPPIKLPIDSSAATKVDAGGKAVEGVLVMNLEAIDRAASGPDDARPNGFVPFSGLGKRERYAEVLGHELTHAAWAFADAERTRLSMTLPAEVAAFSRRVLAAPAERGSEAVVERARELERLSREVEAPAETAEQAIWAERAAGQQARERPAPAVAAGPTGRGLPPATYFSRRAFFTSVAASQAGRMESRSRT